ncbi:hypothetical protein CPB86DRAFT_783435 [Serendipita vermifera]|nr:hypothetical protein CPB86DRAFT_783435 [Serendipita vermifera]
MPKVKSLRNKAAKHQPAAKKSQRTEQEEVANDDEVILEPGVNASPSKLTKKERRLFKRETFQEYVAETLEKSVHSKSAQRRAKRRQKERLAADMSDMTQILQTVLQDQPIVASAGQQVDMDKATDQSTTTTTQKRPTDRDENGRIGESTRAKPLTKQQKKRALALEQKRLPLILSHPAFIKDSFGTIRTHTSNVVARTNSTS